MLRIAMIEFFFGLRTTFRRWKLVLLLLFTFTLIMTDLGTGTTRLGQIYFMGWIVTMRRPKMSKLTYLLPSSSKIRAYNLLLISFGNVIFLLSGYVLMYSINMIRGIYSFKEIYVKPLGYDLLMILLFSTPLLLFGNFNNVNKYKMKKSHLMIVILSEIVPCIHLTISFYFLKGNWFALTAAISYLCVIPIWFIALLVAKEYDTCYENIRKPIKIF